LFKNGLIPKITTNIYNEKIHKLQHQKKIRKLQHRKKYTNYNIKKNTQTTKTMFDYLPVSEARTNTTF